MHTRFFLPPTTVVCKLTLKRFLERVLEWDIAEPTWAPFPQSSHILAIFNTSERFSIRDLILDLEPVLFYSTGRFFATFL